MQAHRPQRRVRYIWQLPDWPNLTYDTASLTAPLAEVHRAQSLLMGRMAELGLAQREQAALQVLTQEVIKTSEIEGEQLNLTACCAPCKAQTQRLQVYWVKRSPLQNSGSDGLFALLV